MQLQQTNTPSIKQKKLYVLSHQAWVSSSVNSEATQIKNYWDRNDKIRNYKNTMINDINYYLHYTDSVMIHPFESLRSAFSVNSRHLSGCVLNQWRLTANWIIVRRKCLEAQANSHLK